MIDDKLEIVRGSGNVYRDLGKDVPDVRQLKALLAAEIIKCLDREGMSGRTAASLAGVPAADLSRIRNANLTRFTVDRLMTIVNRLGSRVNVKLEVEHGRRSVLAPAHIAVP